MTVQMGVARWGQWTPSGRMGLGVRCAVCMLASHIGFELCVRSSLLFGAGGLSIGEFGSSKGGGGGLPRVVHAGALLTCVELQSVVLWVLGPTRLGHHPQHVHVRCVR